jgi:tetratricopeptide (TPR) repeat protein
MQNIVDRSSTNMYRNLVFLLSVPLLAGLLLSAQADLHQRLSTAAELCLQGHVEEAIKLARPIVDSTQLTETERGRGWTMLGSAYQYQGDFQEAMTAYESALRILKKREENEGDFASALSAFGTLFRDMRQFESAAQMEMRALRIAQGINDHAKVAAVCASLADLELGSKHTRKAHAWLDEAIRESKLAPKLGEDFYAFVTSSQAWLAELKGHNRTAIEGYGREVEYLTRSYGEQNPQVGWAFMLLGKAHLKGGNVHDALSNMRKGCAILRETVGTNNLRYLLAQVEYAQALKAAGMGVEAVQLKVDAETKLRVVYQEQCADCRITAMALH